jgi:hypothetical protein
MVMGSLLIFACFAALELLIRPDGLGLLLLPPALLCMLYLHHAGMIGMPQFLF